MREGDATHPAGRINGRLGGSRAPPYHAVVLLKDKDLLARLVGFDSTSCRPNAPLADFVCEYLDRPGITVQRQAGPDPGKVNVIARAGGSGGDDGLTLSGHLDVVPAEEPGWSSNPFKMTQVDGTWVGRGTCDMKASIALAMNLMAGNGAAPLRHPLALLLTYDEELGSLGAQHFVDAWDSDPLPRRVVVGEPTSLRAVRMHKGHLTMRVTVHGKAAHSGSPHLGRNAVESATRVVTALVRLGEVLKQRRCDASAFFPTVPFAVLNVGRIHGGTAVNVVPDRCTVDLGIRLLPGMNPQDTIEWVRDTVTKSDPRDRIEIEVINNNPPMLLDDAADLHRAVCDAVGQRHSVGVSFSSDAGPLSSLGMQCVLFGPGAIEVAHRPDEFVPIDEFERARGILAGLVDRFCRG